MPVKKNCSIKILCTSVLKIPHKILCCIYPDRRNPKQILRKTQRAPYHRGRSIPPFPMCLHTSSSFDSAKFGGPSWISGGGSGDIVVRVSDAVSASQTPRVPAEEDARQPATCITSGWRLPATPPDCEVWLASRRRYVNMLNTLR
jgi:hypothetical protein